MMDAHKPLPPRQSGKFIAEHAKHVSVCSAGINSLAQKIFEKVADESITIDMFSQHEIHPPSTDPSAIDWIFVVDTLNFCFWSPHGAHWTVSYRGKPYTGYFALCAALRRAQDEGLKITDPRYYSTITTSDLAHLLRGDDGSAVVPMVAERVACLRQVGHQLLTKYQGTFLNCVKSCNGSAEALLHLIVTEFDCFRDEAVFEGQLVSFYKRAQILIGDIWACFRGKNLGHFRDIDVITMFADYRVPQVLVHFGTMKYSQELLERLLSGEIMSSGSLEECEIRGCSIHAVELVCRQAQALLDKAGKTPSHRINPILIDHFLWDFRRQHADELKSIPFHKVISVFY